MLNEYATAARAETVWAEGTVAIAGAPDSGHEVEPALDGAVDARVVGWLEPLTSTWSARALLALIVPALILLIVALV